MLSSFTHPHVVQTCISFFLKLNTKEDILNIFEEPKQLLVPIDFHSRERISYGSQWGPSTSILQNIFFCVHHKKETYTGLEWHEGE